MAIILGLDDETDNTGARESLGYIDCWVFDYTYITFHFTGSSYSPHSADFTKSPDPAIFHERGQPLSVVALRGQSTQRRDQLNCPLIWAVLKPLGGVAGGKTHAFMQSKRVVIYFDKLLSVIVRRCEQHVCFKLTNKRPTDTLFIDKQ